MRTSWKALLAGSVAAAALVVGVPVMAQTPSAPTAAATAGDGAQPWAGLQQFTAAETALRQQMQGWGANTNGATIRQYIVQLQQSLTQAPQNMRSNPAYTALVREVTEANASLTGDRPDMNRARTEIEGVLNAIPAFRSAGGFQTAQAGATTGATAQAGTAGAAAGAQVIVREQSAQIEVQQAQPQVTVTQPEPIVTVVVPPPEIIVRQPPPQVTVQIPQPQVAVAQQQPQVRVVEAQPQVQVQAAQPQIQVQQAQPRVTVQQQGQPQVRVEQQGQPVVNIQREAQVTGQAAPAPGVQGDRTLQNQTPAVVQGQVGSTATTAQTGANVTPAPAQGAGAQPVAAGIPLTRVQSLVGTNVVGANGQNAGEIENLLIDRNGQVRAAVIEWGGFLGIGTRRAAVPIERIQFGAAGERARLDMTREQLEQLGAFEPSGFAEYSQRQGWGEGARLFR